MRSFFIRAVTWAVVLCVTPAFVYAQQSSRFRGGNLDDGSNKLGVGKSQGELSKFGHVLAPNVVFAPTLTLEAGHNSNPDLLFSDAEASPYGLANLTGVFGFIRETGATTLTLRGTSTQYDGDVDVNSRWDAGFALDNAYAVAPGMIATFGGFYLRDEISLVPSDSAGGYGQLSYSSEEYEAFARAKLNQIGYLGRVDAVSGQTATQVALSQPSQFDVQRAEAASGFIIAPNARIGYYAEIGGANLDYYSQGAESELDRDATEYWLTGGLRFNLHPTVVIDGGWRFNARQTEDPTTGDVTSDYFDGRVTWTPISTLQIVAEADRSFDEPVSTFGVVSDKIHYGASVYYRIRPDLELSAGLYHNQIEQLGDTADYHETGVTASVSYSWNEKIAIYGLVGHAQSEEQSTGETANRLHVGAGTKIQF